MRLEIKDILEKLVDQKTSITKLEAPEEAGIYAIFHKIMKEIMNAETNNMGLVYIGLSNNLAEREFETHFQSCKSGFSTLRRTIGAIFKEDWGLKAIPRSEGISETNVRNYKFTLDGEIKISKWMNSELLISVKALKDIESTEKELIKLSKPLFNLTGWPNPYRKEIKVKRKICANEARKNRNKINEANK